MCSLRGWIIAAVIGSVLCAFAGVAIAQESGGASNTPPIAAAPAETPPKSTTEAIQEDIDGFFGIIVGYMAPVLFFPVYQQDHDFGGDIGVKPVQLPLIVLVLFLGGIFFTFRYGFVNVRLFRHAIDVVRGRYDNPNDAGEVSHFKALSAALAATVGLGNIAGVAIAISLGGPGAVFWMWITAIFGMTMKFSECTLAQAYRRIGPDGHVLGGPFVYLREGIRERFPVLAPLAAVVGPVFAVLTIFAAFGGGNMFQSNQTFAALSALFEWDKHPSYGFAVGLVLAIMTGVVIIGGIRRIGDVSGAVVPFMCVGYIIMSLIVVGMNITHVPAMLWSIVDQAFAPAALYGGFVGVLVQGMKRAAFSNEAGLGSAAIAHSAAKAHEPIHEGLVAMLGPFIDTIIVCTMTALVILITEAHLATDQVEGMMMTSRAFGSVSPFFPWFLTFAVVLFAYSTLIGWSYYGERAVEYLFGKRGIGPYRTAYVLVAMFAPLLSLQNVVDFADMMLLSMAFPNILGMVLLSGQVKEMTNDYIRRLKSGEVKKHW